MRTTSTAKVVAVICCMHMIGAAAASSLDKWMPRSLNPVEIKSVAGANDLIIADGGVAKAVLVIPPGKEDVKLGVPYCPGGPVPFGKNRKAAEFAAEEIVTYIKKTTGAELPVVTSGEKLPDSMTPVFIGDSPAARAAGFTADGIPPEGFRVTNNGKAIAIIGAPPGQMSHADGVGSVLFGAYDFLERFVGVRFYTHGELCVVTHPCSTLPVPGVTYCDWPRYEQRVSYSWMWRDRADNCSTKTALRMRSGNHGWGSLPVYQHTPFDITTLFKGEDKVKCLALDKNGRRSTTHPPVPCYGNPKTADYIMQAWEGFYARDKDAVNAVRQCVPDANAIGFSCPDHSVACYCEFCVGKTNGVVGVMGSRREALSEHIGRFAAQMSHRVKERFPGKRFYWLPYASYCSPPKTAEFADNTYFRLCFMCGTSVYLDPVVQKRYRTFIDSWKDKGARGSMSGYLYTWPDVENEIRIPYEFPHALKRFFTDMQKDISGFFLCFLPHPNVHPLSTYCEMRLLWNPAFDVDACAEEMYDDLFGPMAPAMKRAYVALTERFESVPASSFKYAIDGGPGNYEGPRFLEDEAFNSLFTEHEVAIVESSLAEADAKCAGADAEHKARYDYFSSPFRILLKRRGFWKQGGATTMKSIVAGATAGYGRTMKIDGVLDEKFWEKALPARMVRSEMVLYADKPDVPTTIRVVRYSNGDPAKGGVLVGMEMEEPEMDKRVNITPDHHIYWDDNVEVFFDAKPDGDKRSGNFLQYVISSDGRILCGDGKRLVPGSETNGPSFYAVHRDKDKWSIELFIPYDVMFRAMSGKDRAAAKTVKANFARRRVLNRKDGGRNYVFSSRWRTNFEHDNANIKQFGDVVLRRDQADFGDVFAIDPVKVDSKPSIDGCITDGEWGKAAAQKFHHAPLELKLREADVGADFKVLRWDDPADPRRSGLCFGFRFSEPDIANIKPPVDSVGFGDCVDFRLELASQVGHILHYIFDLHGRNAHFGYSPPEYAVVKGQGEWTLELFVPFKNVFSEKHPVPEEWPDMPELRFNMCRRRNPPQAYGRETSYWSVNSVPSFGNLDSFGVIRLRKTEVTEPSSGK